MRFYIHGIKINSSLSFFYIIALSQGDEYDGSNSTINTRINFRTYQWEIPVLILNHSVGSARIALQRGAIIKLATLKGQSRISFG